MRLTLVSLIMLLPTLLMAGDTTGLFDIYINGDIAYTEYIMTAISKIFTNGNPVHGYYSAMLSVSMLIGIIMATIKAYWKHTTTGFAKEFAIYSSIIAGMSFPVTVHIEDTRGVTGNTYTEVSNIPAILALMYGSSSYFEYLGVKVADEALATIGKDYRMGMVGFSKTVNDLILTLDKARRAFTLSSDVNTSNFAKKFEAYLAQCVVPNIPSNPSIPRLMRNPKDDVIFALKPSVVGVTDDTKVNVALEGETISNKGCKTFYRVNYKQTIPNL